MKITRSSATIILLLFLRVLVSGQVATKATYVKLDNIFAEAATRKTNEVSEVESERFGHDVGTRLATAANMESQAAKTLLDFQDSSDAIQRIKNSSGGTQKNKSTARADFLIYEYTVGLVEANAKKGQGNQEDLNVVIDYMRKQLLGSTVQEDLLVYVKSQIGDDKDPEAKTLDVLANLRLDLNLNKQAQIVVAVKANNKAALIALNLPPPACIIFHCCH